MKSLEKLAKLAEKFEHKLIKQAEEVDSTNLTLSIRPKLNALLEQFRPRFAAVMQRLGSGDIKVGEHFFTNAQLVNKNWVVSADSHVQVSGSQADNPAVVSLVKAFNTAAQGLIAADLRRMQAGGAIQGDTITNHDTWLNSIDLALD